VGYAGGTGENPTYHDLGDHTETVQIDYDPNQVSYEDLLDVFWKSHNPRYQSWSKQYMTAIFYHSEEQKRLAEETKKRIEELMGGKVATKILPASAFYRAEDYHQKYALRRYGQFLDELRAAYPHEDELVDSTAAARVNAYLSGHGTMEELQVDIDQLGLSEAARDLLLRIVTGQKSHRQ
jgi:peptide-methionine (S)-S-oxide reductase